MATATNNPAWIDPPRAKPFHAKPMNHCAQNRETVSRKQYNSFANEWLVVLRESTYQGRDHFTQVLPTTARNISEVPTKPKKSEAPT
jgi:hypothetical protein